MTETGGYNLGRGNDGMDGINVVAGGYFFFQTNNICFWNVRGFNRLKK